MQEKRETDQSAQVTSQHDCYSEMLHASLTSLEKKLNTLVIKLNIEQLFWNYILL